MQAELAQEAILAPPANLVILIPAYKPGADFPAFVRELVLRGVGRIIVVDDGSGREHRACFEAVAGMSGVVVLRHGVNLGKGAALKTAINALLCEEDPSVLAVTADADGQHHPEDIARVAQALAVAPSSLVLGVRQFSAGVPLRSRFGNQITRAILRVVVGQRLSDTQTGLRGLPYRLLPSLLKIALQGYEFELEMLLLCRAERVPIREVPIRTIYLNANASSHFNPLLDSMRIYFVLLRFAMLSLAAALVDNLIFAVMFSQTGRVGVSQIVARCASMLFNFFAVKKIAFKSRGNREREFLEYAALVIVSGSLSYVAIETLVGRFGWAVVPAKLVAETVLFFVNFLVQRDLIFTGGRKAEEAGPWRI